MNKRPVKLLLYGEPGSGKSSLASTFPKPLLCFNTDARSKEIPYLERGEVSVENDDFTEVVSRKTGELLIRVEHYHDDEANMRKNSAHDKLFRRLKGFDKEYDRWKTVVFDSITTLELVFRKYDEYVANAGAADPRQFYAASAHDLEDLFVWRIPRWPMNVIAIAHADTIEVEGKFGQSTVVGYRPAAPGKIGAYKASAAFTEIYRTYYKMEMQSNGKLSPVFSVQTQPTKLYPACTRIHAPDGVVSHYRNLWPQAASSEGDDSPAASREKGGNIEGGKDRVERAAGVEKRATDSDTKE